MEGALLLLPNPLPRLVAARFDLFFMQLVFSFYYIKKRRKLGWGKDVTSHSSTSKYN